MQICKAGDEETEDVVVDGDDTAAFGPTQFNENDIQTAAADHSSHDEGTNITCLHHSLWALTVQLGILSRRNDQKRKGL